MDDLESEEWIGTFFGKLLFIFWNVAAIIILANIMVRLFNN